MFGQSTVVKTTSCCGAKRFRGQFETEEGIGLDYRPAKAMQAGALLGHGAGEPPKSLGNSKSMVPIRHQPWNSSIAGQQEPVQQPAHVYCCLDDLTSRVEIYKGRHSIVWNVICKRTRKPLILKGYVKERMTERNFHQVRREIRLMQIINYDGAVKLLGHFEDQTTIYLVQEQCAKGDLFKRLIKSGGVLEEKFVAGDVILPMLLTLEYLHARGIYHRDIKPENIFFTKEGKFKLGDFGLAIDATLERSKSRVGTLDYMSPEVVSLPTADERKKMEAAGKPAVEQPYGEKCDIWACGVLAYELMVGRPPFEVKDEAETRKRIMFETTLKIPAQLPPDAVNFIKTALAKNAGMRPSASELIHHVWLRPYLLAMAQHGAGQSNPVSLSDDKATPSLAASCSSAVASTNTKQPLPIPAALPGTAGTVGRSASFTGLSKMPNGLPEPLQVHAEAADSSGHAGGHAEQQNEAGVPHASGRQLPGQLHINPGCARPCSPSTPSTPGPYGAPGMSRKPVWEVDNASSTFTAVRTVGLSGEVPSSPTSPRFAKSTSNMFSSGGGNPLLKAALNANMNKNQATNSSSSSSSSSTTQHHSGNGSSAASNVKQRLREYFVARNPQVVTGQQAMRAETAGDLHQVLQQDSGVDNPQQ